MSLSTDDGTTFSPAPWTFKDPYQIVVAPHDPKTMLVCAWTNARAPAPHVHARRWNVVARGTRVVQGVIPNATIYFPTHRLYAAFDPRAPGTVLVADHDPATDNIVVYCSLNGARSFTLVSTFIQPTPQRPWPNLLMPFEDERAGPEIPYYATRFYGNRLAFNPHAPAGAQAAVVLTTRFGAFSSFDAGSNWQRIDLAAIPHHFIGVSWIDGVVYLASFGEGVIKTTTPVQ